MTVRYLSEEELDEKQNRIHEIRTEAAKRPRKPSNLERDGIAKGKALAEYERNKTRIEAGETYRSQKPSDYRRGASPGSGKMA